MRITSEQIVTFLMSVQQQGIGRGLSEGDLVGQFHVGLELIIVKMGIRMPLELSRKNLDVADGAR
jgi:hypothetical protein